MNERLVWELVLERINIAYKARLLLVCRKWNNIIGSISHYDVIETLIELGDEKTLMRSRVDLFICKQFVEKIIKKGLINIMENIVFDYSIGLTPNFVVVAKLAAHRPELIQPGEASNVTSLEIVSGFAMQSDVDKIAKSLKFLSKQYAYNCNDSYKRESNIETVLKFYNISAADKMKIIKMSQEIDLEYPKSLSPKEMRVLRMFSLAAMTGNDELFDHIMKNYTCPKRNPRMRPLDYLRENGFLSDINEMIVMAINANNIDALLWLDSYGLHYNPKQKLGEYGQKIKESNNLLIFAGCKVETYKWLHEVQGIPARKLLRNCAQLSLEAAEWFLSVGVAPQTTSIIGHYTHPKIIEQFPLVYEFIFKQRHNSINTAISRNNIPLLHMLWNDSCAATAINVALAIKFSCPYILNFLIDKGAYISRKKLAEAYNCSRFRTLFYGGMIKNELIANDLLPCAKRPSQE